MTATTRPHQVDHQDIGATVRVTAREVREAATRALSAVGASSGEASAAADVVTEAELHDRTGLSILLDELQSVPTGRAPVSASDKLLPGYRARVTVLDDPSRRGPLLIGRLALELCVATGRPILVPGAGSGPAFMWTALRVAEHQQLGLELVEVHAGHITGTVSTTVTESGSLYRSPPIDIPGSAPIGVLIRKIGRAEPAGRAVSTTTSRLERHRDAMVRGIDVDGRLWNRVCVAARRFLVPERSD